MKTLALCTLTTVVALASFPALANSPKVDSVKKTIDESSQMTDKSQPANKIHKQNSAEQSLKEGDVIYELDRQQRPSKILPINERMYNEHVEE